MKRKRVGDHVEEEAVGVIPRGMNRVQEVVHVRPQSMTLYDYVPPSPRWSG